VIEPASVIGLNFMRPALIELVVDAVRPEVNSHLTTLTQKQLIRPDRPTSADDFRFEHILIRDAAYNRVLKRTRANLHERFANWAEQVNRDRQRETEYEEILGYHLEQAYRYLFQLGPIDDHARTIGDRAATKLAATGRRAFERGDMAAAANLLERATALLEPLDPRRLALFPELGEALLQIGDFAHAESSDLLGLRTCVTHVEDHFPASILLQLPDARVFAIFHDGLAVFIDGVELEGSVSVAEVGRGGNRGADWSPDQAIVFVVEEAHALSDFCFALN